MKMLLACLTMCSVSCMAAADALLPVRPGGVGGQQFWNGHADWFLYPPSFDFKVVPGATRYRFTVLDDQHLARTFETNAPTASLAPVWGEVPPGFVSVTCEGVDADGNVCGLAGRRLRFWRQAPFKEGSYPPAKRPYAEAAALVYDYLFSRPSTRHLAETGEMDFTYSRNAYPAKMGSALISAMVSYAKRRPERAAEALDIARKQGTWLLRHSQPASAPLAHFPPTYAGDKLTAKQYAGECMLVYPVMAANAYLALYEATKDDSWRAAALAIGETFLRLQGADGTWWLKMRERDGEPIGRNRCFPMHQIAFFERLFALTGDAEWRTAADRAFAFVENGPLRTWNWEGQFEDVEPTERFVNLTKHDACSTAMYLLDRFPKDAARLAQARELLRFSEDQFVCWELPCRMDGKGPRYTGAEKLWVQNDYLDWVVPGVTEQYRCYHPIDASAAKLIRTYLALYRASGNATDLAKARALGDSIVNLQNPDGRIPTHWNKKHFPDRDYDWVNCMLASASALEQLAKFSNAGGVSATIGEDGVVRVSSANGRAESVSIPFDVPIGADWRVLARSGTGLKTVNAWLPVGEGKTVPWYALLNDGKKTYGFGVKVQPRAMCAWRVKPGKVELLLDLRAGGQPVDLGGRTLEACEVVRCESKPAESAYATGRRLCRQMCPNPRLLKAQMFGFNDWYAAYGRNTATNFLADAAFVVSLCKGAAVQPYVVMDDGWQKFSPPEIERLTGRFESGYGPWEESSRSFGMDMKTFCAKIAALGARPGLWYRPLCMGGEMCDPSDPAVLARIRADIWRFRDWGFKFVKIDYLTFDWCGHFKGFDDAGRLIRDDRKWKDARHTTAETIVNLYRTIREAAGNDMVILGCNAVNHLCAGLFEASRVGPDTSGKDWEQTKRNGVGAVAFKGIENGTLFAADPDCAGLASEGAIPWEKNRQWIDLLSRSGMPFFISWRRGLADPEVRRALGEAFRRAATPCRTAAPLDWFETSLPRRWDTADGVREYDW